MNSFYNEQFRNHLPGETKSQRLQDSYQMDSEQQSLGDLPAYAWIVHDTTEL